MMNLRITGATQESDLWVTAVRRPAWDLVSIKVTRSRKVDETMKIADKECPEPSVDIHEC